ncbi:hypothetical protein [Heyndrickxia coagulans]|uniref:hypothetical protein n=1 Tax=Heyndrickxia coagulans TaxID=1398 RepID=UPI00182AF0B6|nr:hypothetical protein [Heyndrickxia coagulans]NWN93149.1 hypothetical protein [Bacillus sp. (in: firmicutes)]
MASKIQVMMKRGAEPVRRKFKGELMNRFGTEQDLKKTHASKDWKPFHQMGKKKVAQNYM